MDIAGFCSQTRLLIVAGKGGVGKTTVTAAIAKMAADAGHATVIIEVEGKSGIGNVFGRDDLLTYAEVALADGVKARTLTPDDALLEYLADHGMKRISKRLTQSGALDVVSTAVPGIKDILVLGKVKQLERAGHDLLVLDAPAAGHAVTFLTSAAGLLDAARVGPIRAQAQDVVDLLSDPERCQVVLVTLPEETPVNELVDTAFSLEDRVGVGLGPVVVNGLYDDVPGLAADPVDAAAAAGTTLRPGEADDLAAAASFRADRMALQVEQVGRLADALPLPQIRLPFVFTSEVGPDELDLLAERLLAEVESLPEAV